MSKNYFTIIFFVILGLALSLALLSYIAPHFGVTIGFSIFYIFLIYLWMKHEFSSLFKKYHYISPIFLEKRLGWHPKTIDFFSNKKSKSIDFKIFAFSKPQILIHPFLLDQKPAWVTSILLLYFFEIIRDIESNPKLKFLIILTQILGFNQTIFLKYSTERAFNHLIKWHGLKKNHVELALNYSFSWDFSDNIRQLFPKLITQNPIFKHTIKGSI